MSIWRAKQQEHVDREAPTGKPGKDVGMLFVIPGAAMIAAAVLIPPADDLAVIEQQRAELQGYLDHENARAGAYASFIEAVDEGEPTLVRRLAAAQLNLIPETADPVSMMVESPSGLDASVDAWIEGTLPAIETTPVESGVAADTKLRRLATGSNRVYTMLAGMLVIFIGLLPRAAGKG